MNALEVSERAIDAWNKHDADALIARYAEDATYHTPRFDHPLKGQAIAAHTEKNLNLEERIRYS